MRRDVLVYISGPITARDGYTLEENLAVGVKAFVALLQHGIPAFCPHLCGSADIEAAVGYHVLLRYDLVFLDRCTHALMLPRWRTSPGATVEWAKAMQLSIPIFMGVDEAIAALALPELVA